jgi:hypothetical protein
VVKGLAVALGIGIAILLLVYGTGEEGVLRVVRWTARVSFVLLCLALVADGVRGEFFGWRRFASVLRSLALSHGVHAVAVATLAVYRGGANLVERGSPVAILGGALAYVFMFWGALRPASRVVSFGLVWIWAVFMVSYGWRAMRMPAPFAFVVGVLVLAMAVRVGASLRRSPRAAPAFSKGGAA